MASPPLEAAVSTRASVSLPLLPGERIQVDLPSQTFLWATNGKQLRLHGRLLVSTYEMKFVPDASGFALAVRFRLPLDLFSVAVAAIARVEEQLAAPDASSGTAANVLGGRMKSKKTTSVLGALRKKMGGAGSSSSKSKKAVATVDSDSYVKVYTKDCRVLTFGFASPAQCTQVHKIVQTFAFPSQLKYLFAFDAAPKDEGWASRVSSRSVYVAYDRMAEWARMRLTAAPRAGGGARYRICNANTSFALCSTYPAQCIVPSALSDGDVASVATFRSSARFPLFCWCAPTRAGATLWRSSQPLVGAQGDHSASDERMLRGIAESSPAGGPAPLLIADCRPRINAETNKITKHGGYETVERYPTAELVFLGIENIHAMRHSLRSLTTLVCKADSTADNWNWLAKVEGTKWLGHIRRCLAGSIRVASALCRGRSVLVHCSDGWDRTAQICALAEIMVEPEYRTLAGFAAVCEKEFQAAGHRFRSRLGHLLPPPQDDKEKKHRETSPIFLQFIDCVWQLHSMLPTAFEFNTQMLLFVASHVHSCRFSTFTANCEAEAIKTGVALKQKPVSASIWRHVIETEPERFRNELYVATNRPLIPPIAAALRHVTLWSDYFLRWSPAHSIPSLVLLDPAMPLQSSFDASTGAAIDVAIGQLLRNGRRSGGGGGGGGAARSAVAVAAAAATAAAGKVAEEAAAAVLADEAASSAAVAAAAAAEKRERERAALNAVLMADDDDDSSDSEGSGLF